MLISASKNKVVTPLVAAISAACNVKRTAEVPAA